MASVDLTQGGEMGTDQPDREVCEHGEHPSVCLECLTTKSPGQFRAERGAYCRHNILRAHCVACTRGLKGFLYATGGGTHFHTTPECTLLAVGQEKVRRRGGTTEPIVAVHSQSGVIEGLDPCAGCATRQPIPQPPQSGGPSPSASTLQRLKAGLPRLWLTVVVTLHGLVGQKASS